MTKGLEFDPGFGPYVMAFQGTVEYLYSDINRFRNLSQKKLKFRQYYKKILQVFDNNLGFYIGCLMWAAYIKTQKEQEITGNHCYGKMYDETENTFETDFMIKFIELFPRDMKYFLGENFVFEPWVNQVLDLYREFLIINKGFVETKTNSDIKLPAGLKIDNAEGFKSKIDQIIQSENLSKFSDCRNLVL